jgi:hypothetical protein
MNDKKEIYIDPVYLRELSDKELASNIALLEKEMCSIDAQINAAKGRLHAVEIYADPIWFSKAKTSRKYKGFRHQQLLVELGRRTKERKHREQQTIENRFIRIAKIRLLPDLFQSILDEAKMDVENGHA